MGLGLVTFLAVGFGGPILWWGLGLGSIPVVVHLLHKRKYRESQWAAMRFLLEAARKNARRIRLEQLLLLAVRVLILLFLAAALRGNYDQALGTYFRDSDPVHRIVVIDASFSMGYRQNDSTHFAAAADVARRIVNSSARGDVLNLLRIADSEPRAVVRQPSHQTKEVLEEIGRLELSDEPGDVPATLREVVEMLKEAPEIRQKEVTLISDFQQSSWAPASSALQTRIRQQLETISQQARMVLVQTGSAAAPNAAVTGIASAEPFATAGRPVQIEVTARAFGIASLPRQLLELFVDDRLTETRTVDLSPGVDTKAIFTHTFGSSGEHRIQARLQDDPLPVDNRRSLALPVKERLNVLLVNGTPAGRAEETATYHLQTALAPQTNAEPSRGIIRPDVINWGELSRADLTRYDCVFLCNIELFTRREAEILEAYVASGGGLVISLGDQVRPDNYNQFLFRDGKGILPAKLGDRVGNAEQKADIFTFDADQLDHPIVNAFQGNPGKGLEATLTFEYFATSIPDGSLARAALRFNTADAAIIDAPFGRGRTILIATSLDKKWGTWAVWAPSFVPLMHETVLHAVSGQWRERQLLVGEPLTRLFPTRVLIRQARIKRPDAAEEAIAVDDTGDAARVAWDGTRRSGIYQLVLGPPLSRSELFAVNVDPRESDLQSLTRDELQTELLAGQEFDYRTAADADYAGRADSAPATAAPATAGQDAAAANLPQPPPRTRSRAGLARGFLFAALALLLVEQLMAWNFSWGFLLLYGLAAVAVVANLLPASPFLSALSAILFAAALAALLLHRQKQSRSPHSS